MGQNLFYMAMSNIALTTAFLSFNVCLQAALALAIQRDGTNVVVSFAGHLQSASAVDGPYKSVIEATTPYVRPASQSQQFWRSRIAGAMTIACGPEFTMAIKADGTLWGWGSNENGYLGIGIESSRVVIPQKVGNDSNWVSISCGNGGCAATKSDGTLWHWGYQIGNSPVRIGTDTNWLSVAVGEIHYTAMKTDGTIWTWGGNQQGQLGNGTYEPAYAPLLQGPTSNWLSVASGWDFSLALRVDGSLWAWGDNDGGSSDPHEFVSTNRPMVFGTAKWHSVAPGFMPFGAITIGTFAAGVQLDRSLWTWGYNSSGQLGTGNFTSTNRPVQVGDARDWTAVSCGTSHTLGLKADGSLWSWGSNARGQLGVGANFSRTNTPIRVGEDTDWVAIAGGQTHTVALKADRTLWAWGDNFYGQLGDGTTNRTNRPIRVLTSGPWAY